jgi:hypothetical protein
VREHNYVGRPSINGNRKEQVQIMTNNTIKIVLLKVWFFNPCPGVIGLKEQDNYLQLKDVGINFTGKK